MSNLNDRDIDQRCKDAIAMGGRNGRLEWATANGFTETVVTIIEQNNIDINEERDDRGYTLLHIAAKSGYPDTVNALIKKGANPDARDKDGNTPFKLATDEEIKTLLQPAGKSDDGSVDESSTDSKGGQEEDAGAPGEPSTPTQNNGGQINITSAGEGTGVQDNGVNPATSTQTEEQPSSFFGSLFSILMKPFPLIGSFFSGFFSWLFGSNEEKTDESTSQTDADVFLLKLDSLDEEDSSGGHYSAMNTDV